MVELTRRTMKYRIVKIADYRYRLWCPYMTVVGQLHVDYFTYHEAFRSMVKSIKNDISLGRTPWITSRLQNEHELAGNTD
jgi:hypothetical protein